jgi:PEGA domain
LHPKFASAIKKVTGQNTIACAPERVATQTALQSATVAPVEQMIEREISVKAQPVTSSRRDPGILQLDVRPWGQVVVNNKPLGLTPPSKEFKLAPGLHNVEIRNGNLEAYRTQVEVFEGGVVRISHHF